MTKLTPSDVRFVARVQLLRAWFEKNHASAKELWIGYYKRGVDRGGVTYAEAVEEMEVEEMGVEEMEEVEMQA